MNRFVLISLILLCQVLTVSAQKTKSTVHFKSIRIENGDTIVEEKNMESDDPNFNFSDSISGGGFTFRSGMINPNDMIKGFGISPFQGFPTMPQFENPFFNDSLINQFFQNPIMDTAFFNQNFPNQQNFIPDNSFPQLETFENNQDYNLSDFKVAILPESNLMNVTFQLSPDKSSVLKVLDENGQEVFSENYEKSDAFYVKQINISDFKKGEYSIVLKQGGKEKTSKVIIDK
jgi:hypothetical protein